MSQSPVEDEVTRPRLGDPPPDFALAVEHLPIIAKGEVALHLVVGVVSCVALARYVQPPFDDDDHTLWLMSLFALPPLALGVSSLAWNALAPRLAWSSIERALTSSGDSKRALAEGGVTTLQGSLRRSAGAGSPEVIAWVERMKSRSLFCTRAVGDTSVAPSEMRPMRVSSASDFELELDDGTRIAAEGGPWQVYDPLGGHTLAGRAELSDGDRVVVKARVAMEAVGDAQAAYRAAKTRPRIVNDEGVMAPVGGRFSRPPRSVRRFPMLMPLSVVVVLVVGLSRFFLFSSSYAFVAKGARCDSHHFCPPGSSCSEEGPRRVCTTECTTDEDCRADFVCEQSIGMCGPPNPFRTRPVGQGEDCARRPCAVGFECIRPIENPPLRDGGRAPEQYCVKQCRDDDECGPGLRCVMPGSQHRGICDREESLPLVMRILEAMRRDAALPALDAAEP